MSGDPREAMEDYRAKISRENPVSGAEDALPAGDPDSGVMVALEPPQMPEALDALWLSLQRVGHPRAFVVAADGALLSRMLSAAPAALVAVGPRAARAIDELRYPLAREEFSGARPGEWFVWSKAVRGLLVPSLAPALDDEEAKREFWRAFLVLRALEHG